VGRERGEECKKREWMKRRKQDYGEEGGWEVVR